LPESFAEVYGPTVLLVAGILLVAAAIAAVFTGHQWTAGGMVVPGLVAIAMAAMLSRMEGKFTLFGLSGSLRPRDRRGSRPEVEAFDDIDGPAGA
jgi:hypothetical protein